MPISNFAYPITASIKITSVPVLEYSLLQTLVTTGKSTMVDDTITKDSIVKVGSMVICKSVTT